MDILSSWNKQLILMLPEFQVVSSDIPDGCRKEEKYDAGFRSEAFLYIVDLNCLNSILGGEKNI